MFRNRSIRLATVAALALCAGACGDDPSSPGEAGATIEDYVAAASIGATEGTMRSGVIPRPRSGGPTIAIDGHLTIVNGGTSTLTLTSPTPFQTVYVAGSAPISGLFLPVSGFWEIPLPGPTPSAELLIRFPQTLPTSDFGLYFAAVDPEGHVGPGNDLSFDALFVGTGDVQVTVAWDTDADVDLHVVDPEGSEIYWADRQSPSGGELDLDSNAGCATDNVRNENITWGVGFAPQGTYTVRVDYWSSCGVAETKYTVLINSGGDIAIHHGTFHGSGDGGGLGSGVLIDTFTRTTGPLPAPPGSRAVQDLPAGPTTK